MPKIKEYKNDDLTVVWKPDLCMHSANCVKGSPRVFDPERRPWIEPSKASSDEIANTVANCPSGAISIKWDNQPLETVGNNLKVQVLANGPYLVIGDFSLEDSNGNVLEIKEKAALCRCGQSKNKPLCDGTHSKVGFTG